MKENPIRSLPGIPFLLGVLLVAAFAVWLFATGIGPDPKGDGGVASGFRILGGILLAMLAFLSLIGLYTVQPNQSAVVSLFGAQFITWRGIPIVPSDKVPVEDGKTKFILVRTGEERQGVVGLFQPGLVGEQAPGLSVRFTGINRSAIASYLVTLYSSLAVLTDDALAVLDDVAVDLFHEYQ